jgi:hypothetical protein
MALALLGGNPPVNAHPSGNRAMYVTFNGNVQLPGATLAAGTYKFELLYLQGQSGIVRVSDRLEERVVFQGITRKIQRPRNVRPNQLVTLGRVPKGEAVPILVWYPTDDSGYGYQFVY